jgi:cystathionine beta-lyase/cystathionine gamma-synthase
MSSVAYELPSQQYLHQRNFSFQVGIEDVDDLIADIEQALQTAPK